MADAITPAKGYHLSDDAKATVYERMRAADEKDIHRQITGMTTLRAAGAGLGVVFLVVNAYQATWALMKLAGAAGAGEAGSAWSWNVAGLSLDQIAVGLTAFGLILAAQVVAIRLVLAGGAMKALGVLLLVGLMAFSVLTSAIHVAFNVQGGVESSIKAGEDYQAAQRYQTDMRASLEAARQEQAAAQQALANLQAQMARGTVSDAGELGRTQKPAIDARIVAAAEAVKAAQADYAASRNGVMAAREEGGGSAMASVIGVVAGWFGVSTASFALGFSLFAVILMEITRVYLSLLTGRYLAQAMAEMTARDRDEGRALAPRPSPRRAFRPVQRRREAHRGAQEAEEGQEAQSASATPLRRSVAASAVSDAVVKGEPMDRTPENKRQAAYSKKLAKVKAALADGSIRPGEILSFDLVNGLVGGNRRTAGAIRNDLANAGVAHWQGARLVAGASA